MFVYRKSSSLKFFKIFHKLLIIVPLVFICLNFGCLTSRIVLPQELPVMPPITALELVQRINSLQQTVQLKSSVSIQFADYKESKQGKGKIYPTADGKLVLRRPQNIRLVVDASLIGKLADMGSDGERFAVAVYYPPDKRCFIRGSNNHQYITPINSLQKVADGQEVSTFSKLRPQHFALPLLIPSVVVESNDINYFVIESRADEANVVNAQTGEKSYGQRVLKTYYILYVSRRNFNGQWVPCYSYWFDRTRLGTPLVKFQIFEEDGNLSTEAEYEGYVDIHGQFQPTPRSVRISRPHDGYAINLVFRQTEVSTQPLPANIFEPQNEENLKLLNLDLQN